MAKVKINDKEFKFGDCLQQLSSLLDNLPGMVFRCRCDSELTFEYASRGSVEILGYEPSQIVSVQTFRKMVHKDDQPKNKEIIEKLTPENNRYNLVYRMRDSEGEDRWIHEQGVAVFSKDGVPIAIEGLLTNITEQKNREIKLYKENKRLKSSIKERYRLGQLIGKSPAMETVYERIFKASETRASVIITGESGTGKELAARAIHELSEQKDKPFVAVNCGAISENLLESEFFGNIKGAFSGAYSKRDGFLMAANGGTLFLDEIGEMPLQLQVKLLRALDGKGFTPVGDTRILTSDFRLISATNRNLVDMVRSGKMREDFYYRINTVPVHMPSLVDRQGDLPILIDHFINLYSKDLNEKVQIPSEIYAKLGNHNWPGNVRELQNVIRRYLTLREISFDSAQVPSKKEIVLKSNGEIAVSKELENVERQMILEVLKRNRWHMGNTAKDLGISRRTLQRRVNKYDLKNS